MVETETPLSSLTVCCHPAHIYYLYCDIMEARHPGLTINRYPVTPESENVFLLEDIGPRLPLDGVVKGHKFVIRGHADVLVWLRFRIEEID